MVELVQRALPKQMRFLASEARHVGYSGAFATGKSRGLCLKLLSRATVPGSREGLCRKTFNSLKKSTLKTLLEPEGELPPVLPMGSYTHNKGEAEIRIHGGGTIMYFGLDDPGKIASMNLSGVGIDEVVECSEDDYRMLDGRVRMTVPGLIRQLYSACNPGPPSHWFAERFGLAPGTDTPWDNHEVIHTKTTDNPCLPQDYIDSLMDLTGVYFERYVMGRWVGSDGVVYDNWLRDTHVKTRALTPSRVILGVDDGFTNPFSVLRVELDGDGRAHVSAMVYQSGLQRSEKIEAVKSLADGHEAVICDPSAAEFIQALRDEGIHAIGGDNSVLDGIGRVRQRLEVKDDGRPRLTVDPECADLIREFETYEWVPDRPKDTVKKAHDHALDGLRYVIKHVDHDLGTTVYGGAPVHEPVAVSFEEWRGRVSIEDDPTFG